MLRCVFQVISDYDKLLLLLWYYNYLVIIISEVISSLALVARFYLKFMNNISMII